jgi:hypothetical protein
MVPSNGEIMGTAARSFQNPIAAEAEAAGSRLSAEALSRRAAQRRQIQGMVGVSYVIDAWILLIYAYAGTIQIWVGPAYALCGLLLTAGDVRAGPKTCCQGKPCPAGHVCNFYAPSCRCVKAY